MSLTSTSLSFQAFCGRIVDGAIVEDQVRDLAAGDRGYRLLIERLERHDAEVDLVAAGFLVVRDRLAESGVLFRDEALYLPDDAVAAAALAI